MIETTRLIPRSFREEDAVDVFEISGKAYGELLCLHEAELSGRSPGGSQRKDGPQRVLLRHCSERHRKGHRRD